MISYASTLPPAFNSLKAHALHHRLALDRSSGEFDRARFIEYLKLPRNAGYMEPDYLNRREHAQCIADLRRDFSRTTMLAQVGDDERLVRDFLEHFPSESMDVSDFAPYVRPGWLSRILAETRILCGDPDMEKWANAIGDQSIVREIKDRVEINLVPSNRRSFGPEEEVTIEADVKNVLSLEVRVFEINAINYFQAGMGEVDASMDLDGLVPAEKLIQYYDDPPHRRVRRSFSFASLARPGTFVVEFIGGGRSSRAMIRKGSLSILERAGAAGHAFMVVDESGRIVPDAKLLLSGREYADYPVDRWRNLFRAVLAQAAEAQGGPPAVVDDRDRAHRQSGLASGEQVLDVSVEGTRIAIAPVCMARSTKWKWKFIRTPVRAVGVRPRMHGAAVRSDSGSASGRGSARGSARASARASGK